MSFLPEDDQEFLSTKGLAFELKTEVLPGGTERHGVVFPNFSFDGNLYKPDGGRLVPCSECRLMILIPSGYATTKLDSFYTNPRLTGPSGSDPALASGSDTIFQETWQFWSRHLEDRDWRSGIDGLETYLNYVWSELRKA